MILAQVADAAEKASQLDPSLVWAGVAGTAFAVVLKLSDPLVEIVRGKLGGGTPDGKTAPCVGCPGPDIQRDVDKINRDVEELAKDVDKLESRQDSSDEGMQKVRETVVEIRTLLNTLRESLR